MLTGELSDSPESGQGWAVLRVSLAGEAPEPLPWPFAPDEASCLVSVREMYARRYLQNPSSFRRWGTLEIFHRVTLGPEDPSLLTLKLPPEVADVLEDSWYIFQIKGRRSSLPEVLASRQVLPPEDADGARRSSSAAAQAPVHGPAPGPPGHSQAPVPLGKGPLDPMRSVPAFPDSLAVTHSGRRDPIDGGIRSDYPPLFPPGTVDLRKDVRVPLPVSLVKGPAVPEPAFPPPGALPPPGVWPPGLGPQPPGLGPQPPAPVPLPPGLGPQPPGPVPQPPVFSRGLAPLYIALLLILAAALVAGTILIARSRGSAGTEAALSGGFPQPGCWATGLRTLLDRPPDGVVYGFCFDASGEAYLSADEKDMEGGPVDACASPAKASRGEAGLEVTRTGGATFCRRAPTRGLVPLSVSCGPVSSAPEGNGGWPPPEVLCTITREGRADLRASFRFIRGESYVDPRARAAPAPPAGAAPGAPPRLAGRRPGDSMSFLEGKWVSSVDAEALGVGFPPVYEYTFDADGKAEVVIRDRTADGTPLPPCTARAEASLRSGGILVIITGFGGTTCHGDPGRVYPPRVLGCFPGREGEPVDCMLQEEGRTAAVAVFRRVGVAGDSEP
ncbi:MAG: hypothetical protein LBR80_09980 [Deltaproteobacteria bacterium]|jgi:hypothetical protein|nr:hypothetical protein [Deltaproteobacteria bacterium]